MRGKLNQLAELGNILQSITGDDYINVNRCGAGITITLNIATVVSRVPKVGGGGAAAVGSFAMITSKANLVPPFKYAAVAAKMDANGVWTQNAPGGTFNNVFNIEEQGVGGQWVNPLNVGDVGIIYAAPGVADTYIIMRSHYRGTY